MDQQLTLQEKKTVQEQINYQLKQNKQQISQLFSINKDQILNMNVVQSYFKELSCKQCGNIPNEVQVCPNCFNIYCVQCPKEVYIPIFQETKNICNCRRAFIRRLQSEHVKVKIPIIDALVNKIDVHCKFQVLGCQAVVNYESRQNHEEQECDYALLNCTQQECPAIVYKKDLQIHIGNCDYRLVNCEYCDAIKKYYELNQHMLQCYKRPAKCDWCLITLQFCELHSHQSKCPKKEINCEHCMTTFLYEKLGAHIGENCQKKQRNFYQRNFYKEKTKTEKLEKITNDKDLIIKELQETLQQLQESQQATLNKIKTNQTTPSSSNQKKFRR